MRIKLTDVVFCEQCSCAPWTWDLYQTQLGVRKGELIKVEKPLGVYGITLLKVLEYTPDIHLQLKGETLDLKEYIKELKEIQNEVAQNIKESINKFNELSKNDSI